MEKMIEGIVVMILIFMAFCIVVGTMLLIKGFIDSFKKKNAFLCQNCQHISFVNENQRGIECDNCGAYFLRQQTVRE